MGLYLWGTTSKVGEPAALPPSILAPPASFLQSGVIHKHLLAGLVGLAHPNFQGAGPATIVFAKLAVLVAVGAGLLVLLPQQE